MNANDMNKEIEIPFGAKDSELKGWEYTIPENMEAEIKDGKIIVKQKESEDESNMICEIIDHCITIPYIGGTLRLNDERKKELKTFVKSLHPHWKPSEEQMEYLAKDIIILGEEGNCKTSAVLNELRNDLQKL